MGKSLTLAQRDQIVQALVDGDRIKATGIYIKLTEAGLTEAQYFIKALAAEIDAGGIPKPKEKRRWFGLL